MTLVAPAPHVPEATSGPDLEAAPAGRSALRPLTALSLLFLAYLAGAALAELLAVVPGSDISIWAPGGLLLGSLLVSPPRTWGWIAVTGFAADSLANSLWFFNSPDVAVLLYLANLTGAGVAAWLMRATGPLLPFQTVSQVTRLAVLGAALGQAVSATLGSATLAHFDIQPFASAWTLWWIGDVTGVLLFAPVVLVFYPVAARSDRTARRLPEIAAIVLALLTVELLFLTGWAPYPYIAAPILLWAAVSFRLPGATLAMVLFVMILATFGPAGLRHMADDPVLQARAALGLQLFIAVSALVGLAIAAAVTQQSLAIMRLGRVNAMLRSMADDRDRDLKDSERRMRAAAKGGQMAWIEIPGLSPTDDIRVSENFRDMFGLPTGSAVSVAALRAHLHPDDQGTLLDALSLLAKEGGHFDRQLRLIPDGRTPRWIRMIAVADGTGSTGGRTISAIAFDVSDQRRIADSLEQSRAAAASHLAELEALYSGAPLGLAMLDTELRFVRINPALAEINGFPPEAHIGRSIWDLVPELRKSAEPIVRHVLETGVPILNVPIRGTTPARPGEIREWREQFYPISDADGSIKGVGIICEEVTEQRRLQRAVQESARKLRMVLDSTLAFVGIVETDGTLVEANLPALSAAGLARSETIGRPFWDCHWWSHDPVEVERLKDAVARAAQGETVRYDAVIRVAGEARMTIDFMLSPVRDASGAVSFLVPSGFDISDRVSMSDRLREREELYRGIFRLAGTGIALTDLDGTIRSGNPALCQMLTESEGTLAGRPLADLVHPDDRTRHKDWFAGLVDPARQSALQDAEFRCIATDGRILHVKAHGSVLHDSHGQPRRAVVLLSDMTETWKASERQEVLLRELDHRSKNLMAVVQSIANRTFVDGIDMAEARRAFAGRIGALAGSQNRLADKGNSPVDLYDVIHDQVMPFGQSIVADGPRLTLPPSHAQTLSLIVHELATNAVKYGALSVPEGLVRLTWRVTGDRFNFNWRETGGPPAKAPDHRGFGSTLVTVIAGSSLSCAPVLSFGPDGLEYSFDCALETITKGRDPDEAVS